MTLQSLLERLEKASGGDREIDARLAEAFGGFADVIRALNEDGSTFDAMVDYGEDSFDECPRYTSSLDAALSLVERVMPGWGYFLRHDADSGYVAALVYPDAFRVTPGATKAASMPLALCLALVRAKLEDEAKDTP